jgi:guanylate kinase
MIAQNELLEYALVYGDYKGVPRSQVQQALDKGLDVVLRLDVQGAARIKQLYPDVVSIFLTAQTEEELFSRLTKRKSESEQSLNTRRQTVCEELSRINEFDYVVINRDRRLGKTVNDIAAIIQAEHLRVRHRKVSL